MFPDVVLLPRWVFFQSDANLVSPRERPLKSNLTLINVFTLVTVSLPLNQTSTYTITPISKY